MSYVPNYLPSSLILNLISFSSVSNDRTLNLAGPLAARKFEGDFGSDGDAQQGLRTHDRDRFTDQSRAYSVTSADAPNPETSSEDKQLRGAARLRRALQLQPIRTYYVDCTKQISNVSLIANSYLRALLTGAGNLTAAALTIGPSQSAGLQQVNIYLVIDV